MIRVGTHHGLALLHIPTWHVLHVHLIHVVVPHLHVPVRTHTHHGVTLHHPITLLPAHVHHTHITARVHRGRSIAAHVHITKHAPKRADGAGAVDRTLNIISYQLLRAQLSNSKISLRKKIKHESE